MPATGGAVVLAEAAFLLAARVAAAAGSLLLAAVAARVLAPAEVGALFYVLAAAWLAAALADLGQQTVLLPELVAARRAVSGDSVGRASPVGRASLPARATRWRERAGRDARPTSRDARPTSRDARPTSRDARPTSRDARPTSRDTRPTNRDTRPTGGWLDASENRRGGALPACPAELVTAALLLQVPVAGVGALFLGLALPIPGREATPDVEALRGLAWLPLLVVPAGLVQACWRASGRVRLAAAAGATGSTFQAGLAVAALAAGAGLPGATAALVAAQAATTLAHLLLGRATGVGSSVPRALRWRATLAHAGRLGRAGLPVVLSAALGIVQLRADLAVLGWSAGATALGGYVLARKLLDALLLLPQAYFAAAFPRRLQSGRMQRGSGRALLGASVLLAGGVALAAGPILGALSGRVPDGAPATLGLLALALPLTAATTLLSLELLAERRYGVVGLLSAAAAALAVALNVLLDGHWAASGAALAAVLSEAAVLPLYWLAARRQRLAVQATSRQVVA